MVNIIGYENVTVGNELVQQPIYEEPIVVYGSGDKQVVISLAEHEAKIAEDAARAEAERIAMEQAAIEAQQNTI